MRNGALTLYQMVWPSSPSLTLWNLSAEKYRLSWSTYLLEVWRDWSPLLLQSGEGCLWIPTTGDPHSTLADTVISGPPITDLPATRTDLVKTLTWDASQIPPPQPMHSASANKEKEEGKWRLGRIGVALLRRCVLATSIVSYLRESMLISYWVQIVLM